jgi:leucyl aminopeptidase
MKYHLSQQLDLNSSECLVIGLLEDAPFSPALLTLDKQLNGLIQRLHKKLKTPGQIKTQSDNGECALMLINCGKQDAYQPETLEKHLKTAVNQVISQQVQSALFAFPELKQCSADQQLEYMVQMVDKTTYVQPQFKTTQKPQALQAVTFFQPSATENALHQSIIIAEAITSARRLADLPANLCTPTLLGESTAALVKSVEHLTCKLLHKKEIETLGMGGLLAVSQGSAEPPCFIELQYQGDKSAKPIVLVGKGITFDAGGISIKPAAHMNEMKYDMAGAASVIGTLLACAKLKLPINLIGLIPAAENLPSGEAVKPGDVITMMSKQTVEVLNTDAEGRLVLADALTYAERFKPQCVIDVATLTGAVIVALGHVASGFMTDDESLAEKITLAAKHSLDKVWRLPLYQAYDEGLDSPVADMVNATFDRSAGSILAGMFLAKFAKSFPWLHLDVAGTAWVSGSKRVSTGRPIPLLVEFLRHANQTR